MPGGWKTMTIRQKKMSGRDASRMGSRRVVVAAAGGGAYERSKAPRATATSKTAGTGT